ncbi:MAG: molybdopterin-dependent oxidoreductase [Chloroflexi bacterium]|nr:molybdopterin-dependent oxidoreductase [Chloroflexota bacterium]
MSNTATINTAETTVMTVCNSHCGGVCPLKLHLKDGMITRIEALNESRACLKGRAYRQRVYAPDRLQYPLKRIGERGEGKFARISWDEALDTTASQIRRTRQTYGPESVLLFYSIGDVVLLNNPGLLSSLLNSTGGCSETWGSTSNEGGTFAAMITYGVSSSGHGRDDFLNSRLIILWGSNPAVSNNLAEMAYHIARARENGTRVISIDPRFTESAAILSDQWIPIVPNTDVALMAGMAHVMITENLHDLAYIRKYTYGFEEYADYVLGHEDGIPKTPQWAEKITGVPASITTGLARDFATTRPAALVDGFAPGRSAYGEQFHRGAITLAAITGNIGVHGGNAPGDSASGRRCPLISLGRQVGQRINPLNPVDKSSPMRKDAFWYRKLQTALPYWGGPSAARVNRHHIADAILKGRAGGYPADYHMLYMLNFNYVNQYGNSNKIVQALKRLDFIVDQEQFMTPTAKFADIVLPTNTFLERNDVTDGGGALFYGYMNQAIASRGEARSHFEIVAGLAARLGASDFSAKAEEDWLKEIVSECKDLPDYTTFKENGIQRIKAASPFVCFETEIKEPAKHPFPTPSGKIEIYSRELAEANSPSLPPIAKYIETWESRNNPLAEKYPLQLITTHTKRRAHSQFDNLPWLRELYPQAVSISLMDAAARGIENGDMVKIFNERGTVILPASVTEDIMPGVVDIPQGAWYDPDENGIDRGGCANVLTRDGISPGGAFCSNTALVQVEKVKV